MVFGRLAAARRTAATVAELPKEVGGMGIRMAGSGGADARIDTDEDADQIWRERVRQEICEMRIFRRRGVASRGRFRFPRRLGGTGRRRVLAFEGRRD